MKHLYVLLSIICFCTLTGANGQQVMSDLYTIQINEASFTEFITKMEKSSGYRFYYDPSQTDSLTLTLNVRNETLNKILDEVSLKTELLYSIDTKSKHIFITRGQKIVLELPADFLIENTSKNQEKVESFEKSHDYVIDYFQNLNEFNNEKEDKIYAIGVKTNIIRPGYATIKGQVREEANGQPVIGASIILADPFIGTSTDEFGKYSITVPKGRITLQVKAVGLKSVEKKVILYSDGRLDIDLSEEIVSLNEVVVSSERDKNVLSTQMGVEKISMRAIKQVPTVMGEPDVLRVMLTLPGVQTVGEASTGFNVRGGAVDQNLILYNESTIYNPSHLFGFFSAINSDFIENVALYKSNIPARFGGRLSSVMNIEPKYGNKKKLSGAAGIGLLTSKFSVGGPIIKDKTSFLVGGRLTYSDWVLNLINNDDFENSSGSFYDANVNLNHEINDNNTISLTGYISKDKFQLKSDTLFTYGNQNFSLKWMKKLNKKTYAEFATGFSNYNYNISSERDTVNAFTLLFEIDQFNINSDFKYSLNAKHTLNFGLSSILYKVKPGTLDKLGSSAIRPDKLQDEQALETALYLEDQFEISPRLTVNLGLRYGLYNYLGSKSVFTYRDNVPMENYNRLDTLSYGSGEIVETYHAPEYRFSTRFLIAKDFSVKASYNTYRQYVHMLTNATAVSPTDIWKLSDPNIEPQIGNQVSLGFYKNFGSGLVETSVEGYYKTSKNYLDYKGGADLVMNHEIETDVIQTKGKAYGIELMIKKPMGKLNGWISYSYSRSLLKADDISQGDLINGGDWYPANHDKPHDLTLIGNYKFSHRFSLSLNCTYSTGRPVTIPIAKYGYSGSDRVLYSDRNGYRIPNYFRTDIAVNIEGNHKVHQKTHNFWTVGVYNLTGRRNAYSTYFVSENGVIKGYKLSIFGSVIPYINFNIRF